MVTREENSAIRESAGTVVYRRVMDYFRLLKFRLSTLVVFSSVFGYLMAPGTHFDVTAMLLLALGGFLVTGASNTLNQVLEAEYDKLMNRTMNRPLPKATVSSGEAIAYALVMATGGITLLWFYFGMVCALLSIIALLSYAFVYTPLKRHSSIAVLVGAFPGAMPAMIGWAAATGTIGWPALILFLIQFIWQFPHFWAIAWILDDDYKKAGFKMLPGGGSRTPNTAFTILVYTMLLIPMWVLPWRSEMISGATALVCVGLSILFTLQSWKLVVKLDRGSARQLMFGSFLYLPAVQISLLVDKF